MRSKLLRRVGYGLDSGGEVVDQHETNIEDTAEPQNRHETEHNAVNLSTDAVAEKQFPGLGRKQFRFPARVN